MNTPDFAAAYARMLEVTGCRTQDDLAKYFGIRQCSISDAKRRGAVPPDWRLALLEKKSINPAWILTGQGEKYLVASSGAPAVLPRGSLLAEMNGPIPPQWLTDVIARTACSLCPKCLLEHRPRCGALAARQALEVWKALRGKAGMDVPAHGTFPENEDAAVIFPEVED